MSDIEESPAEEGDISALPPEIFADLFGKPLTAHGKAAIALGASMREKAEREWAEAAEFRRTGPFRALANAEARSGGLEPGDVALMVVPALSVGLVPVSAERRQAFESLLDERLALALAAGPGSPAGAPALPNTPSTVEQRTCATCRGWCCTSGSDHAHLDVDTLREVVRRQAAGAEGDLKARYLASIPPASFEASCIFHAEQGCTLDRSLRSDTCNDTVCEGIKHFRRTPGIVNARRVFIVAARGTEVVRTALAGPD